MQHITIHVFFPFSRKGPFEILCRLLETRCALEAWGKNVVLPQTMANTAERHFAYVRQSSNSYPSTRKISGSKISKIENWRHGMPRSSFCIYTHEANNKHCVTVPHRVRYCVQTINEIYNIDSLFFLTDIWQRQYSFLCLFTFPDRIL